jgi:hypothetical protein
VEVTLLGMILIPLSFYWALNPIRLLQLAVVSSVFEAAAAIVFGGALGLQPGMMPGLLFIFYIVVQYAIGMRYPGEGTVLSMMLPLLAFLFYMLFSIVVLPDAFAGTIFVWPQKQDPLSPGVIPLQFTFGNVTQFLYLAINVIFALAAAIFLTRGNIHYNRIIGAYLAGGYLVTGLTFWELAYRNYGVWYPDELLQSNPGWAIVKQTIGSIPRLQGPFTEPAGLAFYLSGLAFCCLWLSIRGYRLMRPNLLLGLSMLSMMMSTSTTGIVVVVAGLPMVLAVAMVRGAPGSLQKIGKTAALVLFGGILAIGPIMILKPELMDSVGTVVEATVNKGEGESFDERSGADAAAFDAMIATYGLGAGWGSVRSSSLVPGLAANSGAFGLAMVLVFIARLYRFGKRARAISPDHPGQTLVDGFSASMCGQLAAAIISAPNIGSLAFFLQIGCVVGVLSRMTIEPRLQDYQQPATASRRISVMAG